jgi:hypothetical protein
MKSHTFQFFLWCWSWLKHLFLLSCQLICHQCRLTLDFMKFMHKYLSNFLKILHPTTVPITNQALCFWGVEFHHYFVITTFCVDKKSRRQRGFIVAYLLGFPDAIAKYRVSNSGKYHSKHVVDRLIFYRISTTARRGLKRTILVPIERVENMRPFGQGLTPEQGPWKWQFLT